MKHIHIVPVVSSGVSGARKENFAEEKKN